MIESRSRILNVTWVLPGALLLGLAMPTVAFAHAGHDHGSAPMVSANMPTRLPDGSLLLPKPAQRLYGIRTGQAEINQVGRTHEVTGEVVADPNASGLLQAPKLGRIHPAPEGLPVLGQRVEAGALLAWLEPLPTSLDRANQEAQLADLDGQIALSRQRLERLELLKESAPRQEIEDVMLQLASQEARRTAVARGLDERQPLSAPVSGVVSHTRLQAGAIVDEHEALLELVDPHRLQVTAFVYEPGLADGLIGASARTGSGEPIRLQLIGTGYRLEAQALPLQFSIVGRPPRLALGQPVTVLLETEQQSRGVVLPRAAVVRQGGGASQVWVHPAAERFAPRLVQVQPLDADQVLVTGGLEPGERVVTVGAALLNQVR
jgi:RND family efflux transporter MFP subunit